MTPTDNHTTVQVKDLAELHVEQYRTFKSIVLVDAAGAVLAQLDIDPQDTATHQQYQLLEEALNHRQDTTGGTTALGIRHGDQLTVSINGNLLDYQLPDSSASEDLVQIDGETLTCNGQPLEEKALAPEELL